MKLKFNILAKTSRIPNEGRLVAYLKNDDWDDYSFKTLFYLTVFDEKGKKRRIGNVKIGYFDQDKGPHTKIPMSFSRLDGKYFSLGQNPDYYQNIKNLSGNLNKALLDGLNDIVQDQKLFTDAAKETVTKTSLLREISISSIKGQFRRLLDGGALRTEYQVQFKMPQERKMAGLELTFSVIPESNPPTNIHVLIGCNGVGKTHLLNNMIKALVVDENSGEIESTSEFSNLPTNCGHKDESGPFAGVVSVAFSAFDPFDPYPEQEEKTKGIRYSYVGLKRSSNRGGKRGTPMSHEMLTNEFVKSLVACVALGKIERWKVAIQALESDPLFKEIAFREVLSKSDTLEANARSRYKTLSSGHRIVLLTITKLVEKIEEKTLALIDEPEGHLHPPLLSAFVRALSDLLAYRNGVAIIATHSPVIVQEVPKHCVWKLRRTGLEAKAERPEMETFGENVGVLTREIFGLEVTDSGYHELLKEAIENNDFSEAVDYFDGHLGTEAKGILRALIAERSQKEK